MTILPKSLRWISIVCLYALMAVCSVAGNTEIQITTSDPSEINAQTNDFLSSLIEATPDSLPIVLRIDQLTDALVQHAQANIANGPDQIQFVMNGLKATNIWDSVIYDKDKGVDLSLFAAALLGLLPGEYGIDPHPNFLSLHDEALAVQTTRNFTAETLQANSDVEELFGAVAGVVLPPLYQISYGYEWSTNARTVGSFETPAGLRCMIWINIGASNMLQFNYFRSALVHETWHCAQGAHNIGFEGIPADLQHISLFEGIATYLTGLASPVLKDEELLFWTEEELLAAEDKKIELIRAFQKDRDQSTPELLNQWVTLDVPLSSVPDAPSRSAYYVAYLAVQAYAEQLDDMIKLDESELALHLIEVTRDREAEEGVFEVLLGQEGLSSPSPPSSSSVPLPRFGGTGLVFFTLACATSF